jgi:hypothetical protein
LMALEETPRYREALHLLLELNRAGAQRPAEPAAAEPLVPATPRKGD